MASEQLRLGHPFVRLLPLTVFVDGTNLDRLGKKNATPITVSPLNFTQEALAVGYSKKLFGYCPRWS